MDKANINGATLEYEIRGSGEPVLLISPGPFADGFAPMLSSSELTLRYRLIAYHQRGQAGSTHFFEPVPFAQHAADAVALLGHLGIERAHVAGHSTGAAIALQLAVDDPRHVQTLALLEPPLLAAPSAGAFFEKVGPAVAAYEAGDREGAMATFLSVACSLKWDICRATIEQHVPAGVKQAVRDAETFFCGYLPALNAWEFGPEEASRINQPVLTVLGTQTEALFAESHRLLHAWLPQVENCVIADVAHLLHIQRQEPVVQGLAAFWRRHAMTDPSDLAMEPRRLPA